MKRFIRIALVAAMLFGVASSALATDLKVKGSFDVYGLWSANLMDFDSDTRDGDNYVTSQRWRTTFSYVANENLKAVIGFEANVDWGQGTGGDWGSDGTDYLRIRHAYLDFNLPETEVNVKVGQQAIALPSVFGNPVFDDDASAIVVSAPINDMIGVSVGYTRGYDGNDNYDTSSGERDDIDMAFIAMPITLDGFSATPYFAYAWMGQDALIDVYELPYTDDSTVWVLGANAELTMFDPLTVSADLIYGKAEGEVSGEDFSTKGWYGALAASYKMDMLTASLFGVYFSGHDDTFNDNTLPQLSEGWGITPYIGGVRAFNTTYDTFSGINDACWAVGLKLSKIQFVENLSHELTIAYARGTSDEDYGVTFDENASAWEVYLVNEYSIYENLSAINEVGFFAPDFDGNNGAEDDNSYFATIGFAYKF